MSAMSSSLIAKTPSALSATVRAGGLWAFRPIVWHYAFALVNRPTPLEYAAEKLQTFKTHNAHLIGTVTGRPRDVLTTVAKKQWHIYECNDHCDAKLGWGACLLRVFLRRHTRRLQWGAVDCDVTNEHQSSATRYCDPTQPSPQRRHLWNAI